MINSQIPKSLVVDHINRNILDNRRENLRLATFSQNRINSAKRIGKSGLRGVKKQFGRNKWSVNITWKMKKYFIGYFDNKKTAGLMYDLYAYQLYGEYAYLNFPFSIRSLLTE